jgi:hypothetical protein
MSSCAPPFLRGTWVAVFSHMMNRLVSRTFLFIILATSVAFVASSSSISKAEDAEPEQAGLSWAVVDATVDQGIHVESKTIDGREVEIVRLSDGIPFEIPAHLDSREVRESGLTLDEVAQAREQAREALELTLRGLASDDFNGEMIVDADGTAQTLEVSKDGKKLAPKNIMKQMFAFNHGVYQPMPKGLTATATVKRFAMMAWQFVLVETIHAGIAYYKQFRRVAPRFNEFGIAFDLKIEPQLFVAKFNPTKRFKATSHNWAAYFEIAYSFKLKRALIHTRFRKEKGSGGLGAPALKAELKIFESDGTKAPYKGKAWYPISPPIASFVLDSSEHYFAQGITIGFNSGDLIPFSTLTNTFTDFVQVNDSVNFVEVPHMAVEALNRAAHRLHIHGPYTCANIFG